MAALEALLTSTIVDAAGNPVPTSQLEGYVIGLYFSAHWCPPCRGFTPALCQWFANFKEKHPDKKLAIVFISSDRDEKSFNEYRAEMNFHALPFAEREHKVKLGGQFGVRGIPTLIFVDDTGAVLNANGRGIVMDDTNGDQYPWKNSD